MTGANLGLRDQIEGSLGCAFYSLLPHLRRLAQFTRLDGELRLERIAELCLIGKSPRVGEPPDLRASWRR